MFRPQDLGHPAQAIKLVLGHQVQPAPAGVLQPLGKLSLVPSTSSMVLVRTPFTMSYSW